MIVAATSLRAPLQDYSLFDNDNSLDEFLNLIKNMKGKYFAPQSGMIWRTKNPFINDIIANYFPVLDRLLIYSNDYTPPKSQKIKIIFEKDLENFDALKVEKQIASSVIIGGLPSLWAMTIASILYKNAAYSSHLAPPVYISGDIYKSASYWNSGQYHVRHSTPMYPDPKFRAGYMFLISLIRYCFPGLSNPQYDNYMIADIHPHAFLSPKTLKVGLGYWYYGMKYVFDKYWGRQNITDYTFNCGIISGNIMRCIEQLFDCKLLLKQAGAFRIAYNASESLEMKHEQQILQKYGVDSYMISKDDFAKESGFFPKLQAESTIWKYPNDTALTHDYMELLIKNIKNYDGRIMNPDTGSVAPVVSHIVCNNKQQAKGVVVYDATAGRYCYIPAVTILCSNGVYADYQNDSRKSGWRSPESVIAATGYSSYLLVEGHIKKPVDSNNHHFTPLKTVTINGEIVTLVKTTGGGTVNDGVNNYLNKDYAINNIHYACNIVYPGKKIALIAVKSCSRSINMQNFSKIHKPLKNVSIITGTSGTGVTCGAAIALESLKGLASCYQTDILEKINDFFQ